MTMNSEKSENGSDSSNGRTLKIQVAAAGTLKELGQLRSTDPVPGRAQLWGRPDRLQTIANGGTRSSCSAQAR